MKLLQYKEIQELADGKSDIEATRDHIGNVTFADYTWRLLYFLELRMSDPENPFIVIKDAMGAVEYAGPMSDAKEKKWFSTYQAVFEPEAEWWVKD